MTYFWYFEIPIPRMEEARNFKFGMQIDHHGH